MMELGTPM